jgi:hypothetical protein
MANEMFTSLPLATMANLTDIICAVQGYVSPSALGTSVQQNLGQVLALMQSQIILTNAGDPNGTVAGTVYQLCWDSSNQILYICTTTGSALTAVWTNFVSTSLIAGTNVSLSTTFAGTTINAVGAAGITWTNVTGASIVMAPENGYVANNSGLVTLTLPTTAGFGTLIYISGIGSGGWQIAQIAGQQINIGSSATTVGVSGYLASTNQFDSIALLCTVANTNWTAITGPQGNITVN